MNMKEFLILFVMHEKAKYFYMTKFYKGVKRTCLQAKQTVLTLYSIISVCIFSIPLPRHFPGSDKENLFNNQELL